MRQPPSSDSTSADSRKLFTNRASSSASNNAMSFTQPTLRKRKAKHDGKKTNGKLSTSQMERKRSVQLPEVDDAIRSTYDTANPSDHPDRVDDSTPLIKGRTEKKNEGTIKRGLGNNDTKSTEEDCDNVSVRGENDGKPIVDPIVIATSSSEELDDIESGVDNDGEPSTQRNSAPLNKDKRPSEADDRGSDDSGGSKSGEDEKSIEHNQEAESSTPEALAPHQWKGEAITGRTWFRKYSIKQMYAQLAGYNQQGYFSQRYRDWELSTAEKKLLGPARRHGVETLKDEMAHRLGWLEERRAENGHHYHHQPGMPEEYQYVPGAVDERAGKVKAKKWAEKEQKIANGTYGPKSIHQSRNRRPVEDYEDSEEGEDEMAKWDFWAPWEVVERGRGKKPIVRKPPLEKEDVHDTVTLDEGEDDGNDRLAPRTNVSRVAYYTYEIAFDELIEIARQRGMAIFQKGELVEDALSRRYEGWTNLSISVRRSIIAHWSEEGRHAQHTYNQAELAEELALVDMEHDANEEWDEASLANTEMMNVGRVDEEGDSGTADSLAGEEGNGESKSQ